MDYNLDIFEEQDYVVEHFDLQTYLDNLEIYTEDVDDNY